jgi:hypothetical protein
MHNDMSDYEKKRLETELKNFTSRNFERPADCRNLDQTRYYVKELCSKIEEYEMRFNYVPRWAYALLAQYNLVQNRMLHVEFATSYSRGSLR